MLSLILKTRLSLALLFITLSVVFWFLLQPYVVRNYVSLIPLLFAIQILLNDFLEIYLTYRVKMGKKWFAMIVAPGTILHELSHLFTALITGCYITSVSLFTMNPKRGVIGYVSYTQPKDKWIVFRDLIVGFSPFFGCGIVLLLIGYLQNPSTVLTPDLIHVETLGDIMNSVILIPTNYFMFRLTILSFVAIYFKICFALGSAPSTTDIKGFFGSLIRHPISTLFICVLFYIGLWVSEVDIDLYGHGTSEIAVFLLKASILILLVSISTLVASIPLVFFLDKLLEINLVERATTVIVPFAAYLVLADVMALSTKLAITSALILSAVLLVIFRYPKLFVKP